MMLDLEKVVAAEAELGEPQELQRNANGRTVAITRRAVGDRPIFNILPSEQSSVTRAIHVAGIRVFVKGANPNKDLSLPLSESRDYSCLWLITPKHAARCASRKHCDQRATVGVECRDRMASDLAVRFLRG